MCVAACWFHLRASALRSAPTTPRPRPHTPWLGCLCARAPPLDTHTGSGGSSASCATPPPPSSRFWFGSFFWCSLFFLFFGLTKKKPGKGQSKKTTTILLRSASSHSLAILHRHLPSLPRCIAAVKQPLVARVWLFLFFLCFEVS